MEKRKRICARFSTIFFLLSLFVLDLVKKTTPLCLDDTEFIVNV